MLNNLALPPQAQLVIDRVGGPRQATILAFGLGVVVLILGLARWATSPSWVPVYNDLPLESVADITTKLDEEGITYKLENGGAQLQVASTDLARTRVALAADGGMPDAGRPGLELFDQPSWGMTDFTQRINYRRALEGELERTIGKMDGIETAQVHLAIEESGGLLRQGQAPTASVVLRLKNGRQPNPDVVEGISYLVAGSVDGIEHGSVSVLDQKGQLLSDAFSPDSPEGLASRELEMRSEIEKYLEAKAEQIVTQIVGVGNARVQISAEINHDRVQRTVETVDPERQVLASEQRSEIVPGAEGGAGSTNVTANYLNSRTVETYAGAVGNVRRITAAVVVNDPPADPANPAVIARSPEELARIQALVQSAIGLDESRGDVISVVSVPFGAPLPVEEEGFDFLSVAQEAYRPMVTLIAVILAFVVGLRVLKSYGPVRDEGAPAALPPAAEQTAGNQAAGVFAEISGPPLPHLDPVPISLARPELAVPTGPTLRDQVVERLDEQPEVTLRLIRAWLKEN